MKIRENIRKIEAGVYNYNKNNFKYIVIIILIISLMYSGCFLYNNIQDGDEFTSIGLPAYLSGRDWSNIFSKIGIWHGYGHVWYLFPFLKLCNSGSAFYNVFRINCLITWYILAILMYYLCVKIIKASEFNSLVITLTCVLGNLKPDYGLGLSAETELPLGVIHVVLGILLIKSMQSVCDKQKCIFSFLIGGLCTYTLTIHSRAIVLMISVSFTVFLLFVFCKEIIVSIKGIIFGGLTGGLIYKLANVFYVKNVIASSQQTNVPSHVYGSSFERIINIFQDTKNIQTVFDIFFSLTAGFVVLSFGFLTFFIVIICQYWIKKYKENKVKQDILVVLSIYGMFSWFLMNVLIAIRQYTSVQDSARWYLYLRYAIPFIIIIVLCGSIILLNSEIDNLHRTIIISTFANLIAIKFFLGRTIPLIGEFKIMKALANIFRLYFYEGETTEEYFLKIIILGTIIWFIAIILLFNKKKKCMLILYTTVSIIFTFSAIKCKYDYANETEYYITNASNQIIEEIDGDIDIYCYQSKNFVRYLVINNINRELGYLETPDTLNETNALVLTDDKEYAEDYINVFRIRLDDNEYLYTKDKELYEYIKSIWQDLSF